MTDAAKSYHQVYVCVSLFVSVWLCSVRLQQVLSQVIFRYASHLAGGADSLRLVPAYLCHLRLPERRALSTQLLQTALDTGMDEEEVGGGLRPRGGGGYLFLLLCGYSRRCRIAKN